jgi:hypothetical protein
MLTELDCGRKTGCSWDSTKKCGASTTIILPTEATTTYCD